MVAAADRRGQVSQELERRIRTEWLTVVLVLVLLTLSASYFSHFLGIDRINHAFYDRTISRAVKPAVRSDIVIIAIDDGSIDEMGYWPWRRSVHAQLLSRLGEAKAVGLDIMLSDTNPAYPDDDRLLARAMAMQGRVVLPWVLDEKSGNLSVPLPILAQAAASVGSINAYPDDDAVVRSVVLHETLPSGGRGDHFVLSMLGAASETPRASDLRHQAGNPAQLISYAGRAGSFTFYPYSAVLNGSIPASTFKDKYVLVGAWASGLGDYFPTPVSQEGESMAGVEILANGLQNALDGSWLHTPGRWQNALLSILPVLLVCVMLRRFSPRQSFFASIAVLLLIFVGNWVLMSYASFWFPPAASVIGVGLTYPVWSWRSQEAALQHFDHELEKLHDERLSYKKAQNEHLIDNKRYDKRSFYQKLRTEGSFALSDGSLSARVVKLHQAISLLRQAVRQREEVLRFISHDMRSPQNSILALTQLQSDSPTPLPQPELLGRIDQYATKTLSLVDSFVQLARAESMEMEFSQLDLVDLLAMTCDERWPLAQQRQSEIAFSTDLDCAYVDADGAMLARAFGNLLDNALNYSPAQSYIECRLSCEGDQWLVAVQDPGRGMSAAQQAQLFTPFKRFNQGASGNPGGSGLGLAFVWTVIERHGGLIKVQSAEGQGSLFRVYLPATGQTA